MELKYIVKSTDNYINVLEVLKCEFQISERLLHKLKKEHCIFLNGRHVYPNEVININNEISVIINFEEDNSNIIATKTNLDIIYEDDSYIVINKPAGIPVHPSMDHYTDSLSNGLKYYFDSINLKRKIRPVIRIDKNTSGLVLFAKNQYIQECLIRQMQAQTFQKEYIAVCEGIFKEKQGVIDLPIARKENSIIERCIHQNGDKAITYYKVVQQYINQEIPYSVLKCLLGTGRTHQIRVHMQYMGHSLLGDSLYGKESTLISRQALHSYKLSFIHPITKQVVKYIAPISADICSLIK